MIVQSSAFNQDMRSVSKIMQNLNILIAPNVSEIQVQDVFQVYSSYFKHGWLIAQLRSLQTSCQKERLLKSVQKYLSSLSQFECQLFSKAMKLITIIVW